MRDHPPVEFHETRSKVDHYPDLSLLGKIDAVQHEEVSKSVEEC